ncbi:MAG: hypothetical protein ACI3ZI_09190 [Candidatus Cryptobacteroides sp.]
MNLRVFPFSIIIASALILCTASQCSKHEEVEEIPLTCIHAYLRFVNNSEEATVLSFQNFFQASYPGVNFGSENEETSNSAKFVLYPMESVRMKVDCYFTEEDFGPGEIHTLYGKILKTVEKGCLYQYEYDAETKTQGDLLKMWPVRKDKEENSIFNMDKWTYFQIDSSKHQWNITLYE